MVLQFKIYYPTKRIQNELKELMYLIPHDVTGFGETSTYSEYGYRFVDGTDVSSLLTYLCRVNTTVEFVEAK
jgi:hypothetical protein